MYNGRRIELYPSALQNPDRSGNQSKCSFWAWISLNKNRKVEEFPIGFSQSKDSLNTREYCEICLVSICHDDTVMFSVGRSRDQWSVPLHLTVKVCSVKLTVNVATMTVHDNDNAPKEPGPRNSEKAVSTTQEQRKSFLF